jgi:DinB superfamily
MVDPRYPVGKFVPPPGPLSPEQRGGLLGEIEEAPVRLRAAVAGLSESQLDTAYRDGGWTVRQVVHHVPDSHLNSYVRFRWALTEEGPAIKAYMEDRWAELADAREGPVELSLSLLEALHRRWMVLLRSLDEGQWRRTFVHPVLGAMPLDRNLALYAWHGRHHVAHVTTLRERMGWLP